MAICGNGVVEPGEQCDCGWEEDCKEKCCYPMRSTPQPGEKPCTLRPYKKCSPSQVIRRRLSSLDEEKSSSWPTITHRDPAARTTAICEPISSVATTTDAATRPRVTEADPNVRHPTTSPTKRCATRNSSASWGSVDR